MTALSFDDLPLFGFDVVVADFPWAWETWSDKGQGKSPGSHYETLDLAAIGAARVGDLIAPGGILVNWCTWPLLGRQTDIMEGWGFPVVTGGVWAKRTTTGKLRWGTGYVLRSLCEPFLIGKQPGAKLARGVTPNFLETLEDASVDGLAREHSRKPDEFYSLIETLAPDARRLELFARTARPGWTAWGDEVGKFDPKTATSDAACAARRLRWRPPCLQHAYRGRMAACLPATAG